MPEKQKFYTSFHDLSPREYMYMPEGTLQVGKPGSFSRIELGHLLLAIGVLTIAFTFTFSKNSLLLFVLRSNINIVTYFSFMPRSFLGLFTAFFVHELSHKYIAQKYGLWSEFRMYPRGLLFSLIFAFSTGLVFAAPGAVMFRGSARLFETGKIAAAGPTSNIIIAIITYILYHFIFFNIGFWGTLIGFISFVNLLLATFNLLPIGPLDGKKVIEWNAMVWFVLFSISVLFLSGMFIDVNLITKFFV